MNLGGESSRRRKNTYIRAGVAVIAGLLAAGLSPAFPGYANPVDNLRSAVAQLRASTCPPLRSDPVVDQAAEIINKTTDRWIDHVGRAAPIDKDALPVLKDRGYPGNRAALAFGAGRTVEESIKVLLLQGFRAIPDCSYTDYGVSLMHNPRAYKGYSHLAVLVLAGA